MGNKHSGSSSPEFQAAAQKFSSAELRDLRMKFKSLAERSKGNTVDKASFLRYFPLPGQLGERLFYVFDKKSTGVIDYEEFVCGLALLRQPYLLHIHQVGGVERLFREEC